MESVGARALSPALGSGYNEEGSIRKRYSVRQGEAGYHRVDTAAGQIKNAVDITYLEARRLILSTTAETLRGDSLKLAKVLTTVRRTANFVEGAAVSATDKLGDHAEYTIKYAKAFLEGYIHASTLFGKNTTMGEVDAQLAADPGYQDVDVDDSTDENYVVSDDGCDDADDDVYDNSIRNSLSIKNIALGAVSAAFSGAIYLASSQATTLHSAASLGALAINAGISIVTGRPMTRPSGILAHNFVGFGLTRATMIFCPAPVAVGVAVITSAYSFYNNVVAPAISDHRDDRDEYTDTMTEAIQGLSARNLARMAEIEAERAAEASGSGTNSGEEDSD